jgi:hypothetical protein
VYWSITKIKTNAYQCIVACELLNNVSKKGLAVSTQFLVTGFLIFYIILEQHKRISIYNSLTCNNCIQKLTPKSDANEKQDTYKQFSSTWQTTVMKSTPEMSATLSKNVWLTPGGREGDFPHVDIKDK